MLGTPSLTVKAIIMGVRVQNFRCFQPEGSGSSGKVCPKSITVTTGPPSGFSTPVATENRIRAGADAAMGYPRLGMLDLLKLLGGLLVGLFRSHAAREVETAFLRQQLVVLKRSAPARLRLRTADRLIFVWLYRLFPSVREAAVVFKPETLVRWHRSGFRLYWRWKSRRRVGRPAVP